MNNLNRAVQISPYAATDKHGQTLNLQNTLELLKQDIHLFTDITEWEITHTNLDNLNQLPLNLSPSTAARKIGITIDKQHKKGTSGFSRVEKIIGAKVVEELRSWNERNKVINNTSSKHITQGWKRTARATKPQNLKPKINLAYADSQYAKLENIDNKALILSIVIQGTWYKLYFEYDNRFDNCDKITLPALHVNKDGKIVFTFVAQYNPIYPNFSDKYVIGIDVGITNYVTLSVIEVETRKPVYTTTLSRRAHSLANKIKKANKQVASLKAKGKDEEAALHREANSNRKKELAIIAAQEIAEVSFNWGNALVVFEDLSWVVNTMQNGRWNRGELVRRTIDMVELNGGRVLKVSASNTSRECYKCGGSVVFEGYHTVVCDCGLREDRDVNASANIGLRLVDSGVFKKCCVTRSGSGKGKGNSKNNKKNKQLVRRSRGGVKRLKYPGRDRSKSAPTPKRPKKVKNKQVSREVREVIENKCSARNNDDYTVALDEGHSSVITHMTITGSTIINKYPIYRIL